MSLFILFKFSHRNFVRGTDNSKVDSWKTCETISKPSDFSSQNSLAFDCLQLPPSKNCVYFQLVGTFFIKAATYEFMRYNSMAGGKSHFYSLEYEGENSIFNLLFTGGNAPPVPYGCTHADDWKMKEKVEIITNHIVHIWTILDKNTQKTDTVNCGRIYRSILSTMFKIVNFHLFYQ